MEFGSDLVGMVKTNNKGICKETIEKLTKYCPVGYYLVLRNKPMVPKGRSLINIGYNYNVRKVLSFIVKENSERKQEGLTYLSNYPYQFSNVPIFPVASTLVVYKFFGYVNEVESHNKSSLSDLAVEKIWVIQCGWLLLCITVAMVMTINN